MTYDIETWSQSMLKMMRDLVLVKPIERKPSELIITILQERANLGEVMAVGPGKCNNQGIPAPLDVQVGDIVRIGEFAFPEYYDEVTRTKFLIVQEADIAAIVEE